MSVRVLAAVAAVAVLVGCAADRVGVSTPLPWVAAGAVAGLIAAIVGVATLIARDTRPVPVPPEPEPVAPPPAAAAARRWHCILYAHIGGARYERRRGPVEWPADDPRVVEAEVVRRYAAAYGCPPGVGYSCLATPMVAAGR